MTAKIIHFPGMERLRRAEFVTSEQLRGRMGRFAITDAVMMHFPDQVMEIMGHCIIFAAKRCDAHGVTIYVAMSMGFDQVEPGAYPSYEWQIAGGKWRPLRLSMPEPHGHGD